MSAAGSAGTGQLRGWLRRHAGVRLRLTVAGAAVVAATVAVSGLLLVLQLDRSLTQAAQLNASQRANEIAAVLQGDGPAAAGRRLSVARGETTIAQIVADGRRVIASSPQVDGEAALTRTVVAAGATASERLLDLPVGDGVPYRVVSQGVLVDGTTYQVIVAQSLEAAEASVRTVRTLLIAGLPILVIVTATATFAFVGGTLRPVDEIRRQVSGITARDLSDRVPVPEAEDEVARLARTMNDMLERLERSQRVQRRFVADASHELRSPLATVKANLQLAGPGSASPDWPETLAAMTSETDRLERIVTDLLLLAQVDDSGLQLSREDVDLDDLVHQERQRLRATTTLEIAGDVAALRCPGDPHRLSQVVRNLADNAAAHATERVVLGLGRRGSTAVIEVSDDGPGVPVGDRERIFERFVRLDDARSRSAGGTGLGLAIVREVVRAHGGSVEVVGSPTGGASFRVSLPL